MLWQKKNILINIMKEIDKKVKFPKNCLAINAKNLHTCELELV